MIKMNMQPANASSHRKNDEQLVSYLAAGRKAANH
jgi:hypothetical protein